MESVHKWSKEQRVRYGMIANGGQQKGIPRVALKLSS